MLYLTQLILTIDGTIDCVKERYLVPICKAPNLLQDPIHTNCSQLRHYQLCHSYVRGRHLLPLQLPEEHTDHKAASRCCEPTWNAHYSSTHHQCWYSFYLPTEGWRAESTPSQVELGVGIEPGTCSMTVHCSMWGSW